MALRAPARGARRRRLAGLAAAAPVAAPALIIGTIGLLLNTSALELIIKRDSVLRVIDGSAWQRIADHELEVARTIDMLALRLLGERVMP